MSVSSSRSCRSSFFFRFFPPNFKHLIFKMAPPRQLRSHLWFHFQKKDHRVKCNHCLAWLSMKNGSMGNLKRHLVVKHPDVSLHVEKIPESNEDVYAPQCQSDNSSNEDNTQNSFQDDDIIILQDVNVKEESPTPSLKKYKTKHDPLVEMKKHKALKRETLNGPMRQYKSTKHSRNNIINDSCSCEKNEFALFGAMVGVQMQKFPLDVALGVQIEIQNLIAKKRLEILEAFKKESAGIQIKLLDSLENST